MNLTMFEFYLHNMKATQPTITKTDVLSHPHLIIAIAIIEATVQR